MAMRNLLLLAVVAPVLTFPDRSEDGAIYFGAVRSFPAAGVR